MEPPAPSAGPAPHAGLQPAEEGRDLEAALRRLHRGLISRLGQSELHRLVLSNVREAIGCEAALLELQEGDDIVVADVIGLPEDLLGHRSRPEEAAILAELSSDPGVCLFSGDDQALAAGIFAEECYRRRFMLAIPLVVRQETVGIIVLVDSEPEVFSSDVLSFAGQVAVSVALALENEQLLAEREQVRDRQELESRRNEALAELYALSSSPLNEEHVLRTMIAGSLEVLGADTARLFQRQQLGAWKIKYFAGTLISPDLDAEPLSAAALKQVSEARAPVIIPDESSGVGETGEAAPVSGGPRMLVPLMLGRDIHWLIEFRYFPHSGIGREDYEFARSLSLMTSLGLQNARLYEGQRLLAFKLQQALLSPPQRFKGVAVGHAYASGTAGVEVGGDFYDLVSLPDNRLAVLLGDVSGKGVEAAILASLVKNALHAYLHEDHTVDRVLESVNRLFIRESPSAVFVTLFCGVLDLADGSFRYVQAGHPPGVIRRRDTGEVQFTEGFSPVIGIFPDADFHQRELMLGIGDRLLLYTDGIMEARHDGAFFGEEGVADFLRRWPKLPTRETPARLLDHVTEFVGGYLPDDVAVLCLQRKRKH